MSSIRTTWILVSSLVLLLHVGCDRFGAPPSKTAKEFWTAVQLNDLETARALSTAPDARGLQGLAKLRPIEDVSVGRALKNESRALVETSMVWSEGKIELTFNTHLERFDGSWRVDVGQTASEMRRAALASSLAQAQQAFQQGADAVSDALEEGLLEASQALREALEELERSLRSGSPP